MTVELPRRTLLPRDDVLGGLRESIPKLTRSRLHRCLLRHGIPLQQKSEDATAQKGGFADTKIGYARADICEFRLSRGKLNVFLAIDGVSQFPYVEFRDDAGKMNGAAFLRGVVCSSQYSVHTVPTYHGMAFADLPKNRD